MADREKLYNDTYIKQSDRGEYTHNTYSRDDGSRASYNTDSYGNYVPGSGHTTDNNGNVSRWDDGPQDKRK